MRPVAGGSAEISIEASGTAEGGAFAAAVRPRRGFAVGFAAGSAAVLGRPRRFGDSASAASAGAGSAGGPSAGSSGGVADARSAASAAGSVPVSARISGAETISTGVPATVSTGASAAASTAVITAVSGWVSGAASALAERWRRRCEALAGFSASALRGRGPERARGGRVVVNRGGFAIFGDPDFFWLLWVRLIRPYRVGRGDGQGRVPLPWPRSLTERDSGDSGSAPFRRRQQPFRRPGRRGLQAAGRYGSASAPDPALDFASRWLFPTLAPNADRPQCAGLSIETPLARARGIPAKGRTLTRSGAPNVAKRGRLGINVAEQVLVEMQGSILPRVPSRDMLTVACPWPVFRVS